MDSRNKNVPKEEGGRGKSSKLKILKKLHKNLRPNFYLEIGIFKGRSYKLSTCESIGIDPDPKVDYDSIYRITSDEFFLNHSDVLKNKTIDLSYIDGMHLFEYVLRDFINVEKYCNKQSVIIIDDVFPVHYKQAERVRQIRRPGTGDVGKMIYIFKEYRPDLIIVPFDAGMTGMIAVLNLNCKDDILKNNYGEIVDKYISKEVTKDILERKILKGMNEQGSINSLFYVIEALNKC